MCVFEDESRVCGGVGMGEKRSGSGASEREEETEREEEGERGKEGEKDRGREVDKDKGGEGPSWAPTPPQRFGGGDPTLRGREGGPPSPEPPRIYRKI